MMKLKLTRDENVKAKLVELSPISQEIIDGLLYWDHIGQTWLRLIAHKPQDVVGHYKKEMWWNSFDWIAVRHFKGYHANGKRDQRRFDTESEARLWIEQWAKEHWLTA